MANKALSKRQKLMIRIEPAQLPLKPRNPVALAARQRVAGSHQKEGSAQRQLQKRLLDRLMREAGDKKKE